MKNILLIALVVLLVSCSSNPITPEIEVQLRNQLSKEEMFKQLDSAMVDCNNNLLEWEVGISEEEAEQWRLSGATSYTRTLMDLKPNYGEINDSIKKVIAEYLKHTDWTFVTDTLLKPQDAQAWEVLSYEPNMFGSKITWNDVIMHYIYYNRVPEIKLHLDEKLEDNYYKVTDLKTAKQYILEIKDDSLYSYKILK